MDSLQLFTRVSIQCFGVCVVAVVSLLAAEAGGKYITKVGGMAGSRRFLVFKYLFLDADDTDDTDDMPQTPAWIKLMG